VGTVLISLVSTTPVVLGVTAASRLGSVDEPDSFELPLELPLFEPALDPFERCLRWCFGAGAGAGGAGAVTVTGGGAGVVTVTGGGAGAGTGTVTVVVSPPARATEVPPMAESARVAAVRAAVR
jgi:hypothetical protein